jgi:diacylglycerol kinase family enzyme
MALPQRSPVSAPTAAPVKRTAVVLNANAKRVTGRVKREVARAVPDADVFFTESLEQAQFAIRRIADEGYQTVVTGGGDGTVANTISEIVEAVEEHGGRAPRIGVLRLGTGNAVADFLGARDFRRDLREIGDAPSRPVYLVRTGDGRRATFAGLGWDAFILNNYEHLKHMADRLGPARGLLKGVVGYLLAGVGWSVPELVVRRPRWHVRVINTGGIGFRLDGRGRVVERFAPGAVVYDGPVRMACLGTTPYYGFKFKILPFADKTPGLFHLRLIDMHPLAAVRRLVHAWRGNLSHPRVTDLQLSACRLELDRPAPFQVSGDAAGLGTSFEVAVDDQPVECVHFN